MLSLHHKLYFPELKYEGKRNFKSWGSSKQTSIFSLNWKSFDSSLIIDHHIWVDQCGKSIKFTEALPHKYEKWLNGFLFSIPENYLNEIIRCSRIAMMEWSRALPFDTNIREMCMETAETYIKIAFKLIADCAYDSKKNYFYRGVDKSILSNVMRYRFWTHQTGSGLIWKKAEFHNIQETLRGLKESGIDNALADLYSITIDDFLDHEAGKSELADLIEKSKECLDDSLSKNGRR